MDAGSTDQGIEPVSTTLSRPIAGSACRLPADAAGGGP